MEETFKRIPPEDVFITVFKRKPTEEELWMGVPPDFDGNRPSGNNLIDLFAYLIRKYGRMDTSEYARIMQLKTSELRGGPVSGSHFGKEPEHKEIREVREQIFF